MRGELSRGARSAIPVSLGIVAYALVFGVLVAGKGIGIGTLAFMNLAVFSGSAQFVLVGMWQDGVSAWQMALAAAVAPMMEPYGWFERAWRVHFVTDENWALAMAERRKYPVGANFLLGGGILVMVAWSLGTLAGHGLGVSIRHPGRFGMDFAFTAIFTALAVTMWRGKRDVLPWVVSAGVALAAHRMLPGAWYVLLGGLAGALTAAVGKGEPA